MSILNSLRIGKNRAIGVIGFIHGRTMPFNNCPRSIYRLTTHTDIIANELADSLELKLPSWPSSLFLNYLWLRDHCLCKECYDANTFQKINDIYKIPLSIHPLSVSAKENVLEIEWPDHHKSSYKSKFLWENTYESQMNTQPTHKNVLWTSSAFPASDVLSVSESDLSVMMGCRKLVSSILTYGVGLITEVDPTVEATRIAVEKVNPIMSTFFGDVWAFQADLEHADSAYSSDFLGAHTDTTYFSQAARIQAFHCLQASPIGGDTLLVDGFAIADQFSRINPKGYKFFSHHVFPSEYLESGQHHRCLGTVFRHHPVTGTIVQFRYNIYDRAPLNSIPHNLMPKFYEYLQALTRVVRDKKNEHWFKLEPGTILLVDNWRVMHGRGLYSGSRIMSGCYLSQDSFSSRARLLGFSVD